MHNNSSADICLRCVLPSTFPGIHLDDAGVCTMCREAPSLPELDDRRRTLREEMEAAIERNRDRSEYDCVVAFSGGKDSSYVLLMLVKDYGLRCLAVMVDNGFVSKQAIKNGRAVTSRFGVDLTIFAPAPEFMKHMYFTSATEPGIHAPAAIRRASSVCNSCINLINNHMVKVALQSGVAIIAGGYISGQVPKDAAMLEIDPAAQARTRTPAMERYRAHFGVDAQKYFSIDDTLIQRAAGRKILIVNPLLTRRVTENQIVAALDKIGWKPSKDTGRNSSNCMLNDLGIAVHHKRHGFHPYVLEISEQIRAGLMSREEALRRIEDVPQASEVTWQAERIGLSLDAL